MSTTVLRMVGALMLGAMMGCDASKSDEWHIRRCHRVMALAHTADDSALVRTLRVTFLPNATCKFWLQQDSVTTADEAISGLRGASR